MKRIFTLLFMFSILSVSCLSSCETTSIYDCLYSEYSFTGSCRYEGVVYTGRFYVSEGENFSDRSKKIEIDSPEELSGMVIEYDGGICYLTKNGKTRVLPDGSLICIFSLFDVPKGTKFKKSGNEYCATVDGLPLCVRFDDGNLTYISYGEEYICMEVHDD